MTNDFNGLMGHGERIDKPPVAEPRAGDQPRSEDPVRTIEFPIEVKLSVVQAAPARDIDATSEPVALEYKDNPTDQPTSNPLVSDTREPVDK